MKTAAIVNPAAGHGNGRALWTRLAPAVLPDEVAYTEYPGHAAKLAQRLALEGFARLWIAGGDGTLNEAADGVRQAGAPVALAFLPLGSGGDMARGLGIPRRPLRALEALRRGVERNIDLGLLECRDASGGAVRRSFVNVASIGLGGRVALNRLESHAGYLRAALGALLSMSPPSIELEVDGKPLPAAKAYHVAFGNGRFTGAGMRICPEASLDDGLLDVTVIEARPAWRLVARLHLLYSGRIHSHPAVRHCRARLLRAVSPETVAVEADGEAAGYLPLTASVLPGALRMVVPRVE